MRAAALFLMAFAALPPVALGAPAAIVPADPFVALRAIVAPALACERKYDAERRQLSDEQHKIDTMYSGSATEAQWHVAREAHDAKDRAFRDRRGKVCKSEQAFERLKARLSQMRPDLSPSEVHLFALGFFHDLRRTAEYAADFGAGYNARQYSPPRAPPPSPPRSKTGN